MTGDQGNQWAESVVELGQRRILTILFLQETMFIPSTLELVLETCHARIFQSKEIDEDMPF